MSLVKLTKNRGFNIYFFTIYIEAGKLLCKKMLHLIFDTRY